MSGLLALIAAVVVGFWMKQGESASAEEFDQLGAVHEVKGSMIDKVACFSRNIDLLHTFV